MIADFQSVAQVAASRGLNTLLEGLALAGVSWFALQYFARSSMTRFAVWFSTLLVIAFLPLLMTKSPGSGTSGSNSPGINFAPSWAVALFAVWAVIAGALLARLVFSLWRVTALRRQCAEVDLTSQPELSELFEVRHRGRRVRLLVSDSIRVPAAVGFFRPAIVLPSWTLTELTADELRGIVLHELAHLLRWDDWTNLAQKLVKALFFFHPAVWWIDSRLALEREVACDDMVLEHNSNPVSYAASLVSVAEKAVANKRQPGRALALAQTVLGRVRELSQRIAQILDTTRPRTNLGWKPATAIIGVLSVVTVGAMPYAPELVSFEKKAEPTLSAGIEPMSSPVPRPVSLKWPEQQNHAVIHAARIRATQVSTAANLSKKVPVTIPVKAVMKKAQRTPKMMMTKAQANTNNPATLLVIRSAQLGEDGAPVWTLSVWRFSSENGQAVQQMLMMNSI